MKVSRFHNTARRTEAAAHHGVDGSQGPTKPKPEKANYWPLIGHGRSWTSGSDDKIK